MIIVFVSTCPSCRREQPQDAFSVADLQRLLSGGYPIEAYCVPCDGFWAIDLKERVALGEAVAAASKGSSPMAAEEMQEMPDTALLARMRV